MGIDHELFEHEITMMKKNKGVNTDNELSDADLKELCEIYKKVYKDEGESPFYTVTHMSPPTPACIWPRKAADRQLVTCEGFLLCGKRAQATQIDCISHVYMQARTSLWTLWSS
jgi:hypothetical protein